MPRQPVEVGRGIFRQRAQIRPLMVVRDDAPRDATESCDAVGLRIVAWRVDDVQFVVIAD